ncbi:MAG: hypothetical protein ACI9AD_000227 [Nitriliruptoraceae bacterium]
MFVVGVVSNRHRPVGFGDPVAGATEPGVRASEPREASDPKWWVDGRVRTGAGLGLLYRSQSAVPRDLLHSVRRGADVGLAP